MKSSYIFPKIPNKNGMNVFCTTMPKRVSAFGKCTRHWHFSLFFIFILIFSKLSAQTTLQGTIEDSLYHDKLFYVSVGLVTSDSTMQVEGVAYTDSDGSFIMTGVRPGSYLLRASLVGYQTLDLPVTVPEGTATLDLGTIGMKKVSDVLEGVAVVASKPVYMVDGEKTLYNVSEDPSVQTGTTSDALQNAPGVEVDVEGNITLRGVSSVEIWINDKPSRLNEEGLKTFIQQLPANALERIEVITNPSARYSAKGTGGIINIITTSKIKKNSFVSFGLYGSSQPDVSPWLSYVWSNEKLSINFYLSTHYSFYKTNTIQMATRFNEQMDTSSVACASSLQRRHSLWGGFYFNGDYQFDSLNSISFWAGAYPSWGKSFGQSYTLRSEYLYNPDSYFYETTDGSHGVGGGGYAGIYYEHLFAKEGHKISADISGNLYYHKSKTSFVREYDTHPYLNRNKKTEYNGKNYNTYASVDYTYPYHKNGELSVGVSGDYSYWPFFSREDTLLAGTLTTYQIDSLRLKDGEGSGYSFYAYATLQHKFGNFTLKGGLRSEYDYYDYRILNSPDDNVKKAYWSLYPSLHLSYRTESMHNFRLSYTRRVQNPGSEQLTTFISYSEDSYSMGNPELKQAFTNSVEAGWTKYFQKFGSVGLSAYFKHSNNEISSLSDVAYSDIFGRIVTFSYPMNVGKSINTGAEVNVTYRLKEFMNIRFYGNVYYSKSEFDFRNGAEPTKVDNLGYSFRLNFWAKLWKVLEVHASAYYSSKNVSLFYVTKPRYGINCGLRADFLDRKISVHLNVNDIFNWNADRNENKNPYYQYYSNSKYVSRTISAGITFRFGKMELESRASQEGMGNMNPE